MNIVYISQMTNVKWAGPGYSIPRQIKAQAKYDNVFWYHMRSDISSEWKSHYEINTVDKYPNNSIIDLPEPFNKPDLIIVEQFYGYANLKIRKELIRGNIPYILIPRGELTQKAQNRKKIKKTLANTIIFNKFARNALAIQYLTEDEKRDSGNKWNEKSIVIPNGTEKKYITKENFNSEKLICTNIGRIEPYHKGIDLLIDACSQIRSELIKSRCEFHIYGPDVDNKKDIIEQKICDANLSSIIYIHEPIFGKEKEQVLLESDVFIMTSRFEGHPMALIEAMSYGLPCFVTSGTNMSKEVYENKCGWTASNDVESIKKSILKMIEEKNTLKYKGQKSLNLAQKYDWDEIAKKSHVIYEELLGLNDINRRNYVSNF